MHVNAAVKVNAKITSTTVCGYSGMIDEVVGVGDSAGEGVSFGAVCCLLHVRLVHIHFKQGTEPV